MLRPLRGLLRALALASVIGSALTSGACITEPPPRHQDDLARRAPDARCAPERARKPPHLARWDEQDLITCDAECLRGPAGSCLASGTILLRATATPNAPNRARVAFERGCEYGFGEACARAIRAARTGNFDVDRVARLARRGCDLGDGDACVELDRLLAVGLGVRREPSTAATDLRARCEGGLASACAAAFELSPSEPALRDRACQLGDGPSCAALAGAEEARPEKERDGARVVGRWERACDAGFPGACRRLGQISDAGLFGLPRDAAKAYARFDDACLDGDDDACLEVAARLSAGVGVERDEERGRALLEARCLPQASACATRAAAWKKEADATRPRLAFELADVTCEVAKLSTACLLAAESLRDGVGVPRDVAASRVRFARACGAGEHDACRSLAASWIGVDDARAASFYDDACEGGDPEACASLATQYARGRGVRRDLRRAAMLFVRTREAAESAGAASDADSRAIKAIASATEALRKGCDAPAATGCLELGLRLRHGVGVARAADAPARAFAAFKRGCEVGHDAVACVRQGRALLDGEGTKRDAAAGAKLLEAACASKDDEACVELAWSIAATQPTDLRAPALLDDVCRRGDLRACDAHAAGLIEARLGYGYGDPDERDAVLAESQARCDLHEPWACYVVALADERSLLRGGRAGDAITFHDDACAGGVLPACVRTAAIREANQESAGEAWAIACELGAALACGRPAPKPDAVEPGETDVPGAKTPVPKTPAPKAPAPKTKTR